MPSARKGNLLTPCCEGPRVSAWTSLPGKIRWYHSEKNSFIIVLELSHFFASKMVGVGKIFSLMLLFIFTISSLYQSRMFSNRVFPPEADEQILLYLSSLRALIRKDGKNDVLLGVGKERSGNKQPHRLDSILVIVLGSFPGFGLPEGSGDPLLVLSVSLFDLQMNCF